MTIKNIIKWMFIASFFIIQCYVVPRIPFYNIKIGIHWLLYFVLFLYFFISGDMKLLYKKLKYGLSSSNFVKKAFFIYLFSFGVAMVLINTFTDTSVPIYTLWQPLHLPFFLLWILLYTFLQPAVDNALYHRSLLVTPINRYKLLAIIIVRTYAETGVLLLSTRSMIGDNQMIVLALYVVNTIFTLCYYKSKDESFSFVVEVMYRISLVLAVLIGMPQLLLFSI